MRDTRGAADAACPRPKRVSSNRRPRIVIGADDPAATVFVCRLDGGRPADLPALVASEAARTGPSPPQGARRRAGDAVRPHAADSRLPRALSGAPQRCEVSLKLRSSRRPPANTTRRVIEQLSAWTKANERLRVA